MSTQNEELFASDSVAMDSSKVAWLKRHRLETQRNALAGELSEEWDDGQAPEWVCRVIKDCADCSRYSPLEIAGGKTEDEACAELALVRGLRRWNEELM